MSDPIRTETGTHVTATFNPKLGIVVEIMGTGHVSRMILNPQAARELAEQLDLARLGTSNPFACQCPDCHCTRPLYYPNAPTICDQCQTGDHQ